MLKTAKNKHSPAWLMRSGRGCVLFSSTQEVILALFGQCLIARGVHENKRQKKQKRLTVSHQHLPPSEEMLLQRSNRPQSPNSAVALIVSNLFLHVKAYFFAIYDM